MFYEVSTEDIYENVWRDNVLMELRKVIGKFVDEANGETITKFINLRSKTHSYLVDNDEILFALFTKLICTLW